MLLKKELSKAIIGYAQQIAGWCPQETYGGAEDCEQNVLEKEVKNEKLECS